MEVETCFTPHELTLTFIVIDKINFKFEGFSRDPGIIIYMYQQTFASIVPSLRILG